MAHLAAIPAYQAPTFTMPNGLVFIKPFNDTMRPTISNDAFIGIKPATSYGWPGIYLFSYYGHQYLARLDRRPNQELCITFDSEFYENFTVKQDEVTVHGLAVKQIQFVQEDL